MEQKETIKLNINVNKVDESLKTSPLLLNTSIINYGYRRLGTKVYSHGTKEDDVCVKPHFSTTF